ncbi:MAG: Cna B-type domain-containing protein, partial [Firmicutes bacterium]|nr:Cna B-type domain-containing protein [Bacillota bacterium]
ITVQLKADGKLVESKHVTADDDWEYEFENLYKYEDGKEIKYSVEETEIDGNEELLSNYDVVYDGNNIKNTPKLTSVEITKNLKHNSLFDEFVAKDATFYVALFSDEDRTELVAGPQELNFKDTSKATTTFSNLPVGKTYYVGETDSEGNILGENENGVEVLKVDGTEYIVEIGTSSAYDFNAGVITVENETAAKEFDNILNDIPIGYYKQFTITKKVVDVEGNPMKYTGSFYVTLFEDEECTKPATMDGNPIKIELNGESEKTVVVETPEFGLYYLAETDANGKKVDSSFEFTPVFSDTKAKVTDDSEVSIVLTNKAKPSKGTSGTTDKDNSDKDKSDSFVKTGDSTNLLLIFMTMITSVLLGIVIILRARRRES